MNKLFVIIASVLLVTSCNRPVGELATSPNSSKMGFSDTKPLGMQLIKKGTFMMGAHMPNGMFPGREATRQVTVESFLWMKQKLPTISTGSLFCGCVIPSHTANLSMSAGTNMIDDRIAKVIQSGSDGHNAFAGMTGMKMYRKLCLRCIIQEEMIWERDS